MAVTPGHCDCVQEHAPQPHEFNDHHILPKSWGGKTVASNLVTLCPTTHANAHRLLNEYVRYGQRPPGSVIRQYGSFVRNLAQIAWDQRPSDKPPYTAQHEIKDPT